MIPVYNTEQCLEEALDSVINQSYKNLEIICVNDGSTDASPDILKAKAKMDSRIVILSQGNQGLSVTRNVGLKAAHGDFVYFFDSDDILKKEAIATCIKELKANDVDALFFEGELLYEMEEVGGYNYRYLKAKEGNYLVEDFLAIDKPFSCAYMFFTTRQFLEKAGLKFEPYILHEDELYIAQMMRAIRRIRLINQPLFIRRVRAQSIMTNPHKMKVRYESYLKVVDGILELYKTEANAIRKKYYFRQCINHAMSALRLMDYHKSYLKAVLKRLPYLNMKLILILKYMKNATF